MECSFESYIEHFLHTTNQMCKHCLNVLIARISSSLVSLSRKHFLGNVSMVDCSQIVVEQHVILLVIIFILTTLHCLRDCVGVVGHWLRFVYPRFWESFFSWNLNDRLNSNLSGYYGFIEENDWKLTFGVALYSLCYNRKRRIFNEDLEFKVALL